MSDFDSLVYLADDLYSRYETQGKPSDLSLCILYYRSALTLSKTSAHLSNDIQSKLLGNLANALSMRFQRHGDIADLDHSVECHLTVLDFRPPGHPGRANSLSNFATALLVRYGKFGMQKDIELAIKHFHTALSILPPDRRLMPLMNYASALFSRFQCTGAASDLNDAIHQYHVVLSSSPGENISSSYYNLANALFSRFKMRNDTRDLENCIKYSFVALHDMNKAHPDYPLALSCLSTALIKRFEMHRGTEDLHLAIENLKSALELRSADDSQQFMVSYDLADALMMRYELQPDLPDLELAIKHYRTSLSLLPPNHKSEGIFLESLGNALFLRFSRLEVLCDLEEAIQKLFIALEIHSPDLHRRVATLEAVGASLDARFEQLRDPEDLHSAINFYNEALNEICRDHHRRPTILQRTATSLERRFRLYGEIMDLDRSISYCREALELLPSHHPDRATSSQVLAYSLLLRFEEEAGDELDLNEAILHCNTSMNLSRASDSLRATRNLLLARILKARVLPWQTGGIESVLEHLLYAKDLCTLSHPLISDVYAELASTYYLRFLVEQKPSDLNEAFGHHELSMSGSGGNLWPAFHASLEWVRYAETYGHRSGVDVYRNALRLVKLRVSTMRSPELRQRLAKRHALNLAYDGASFALRFQELMEAVEVFEAGRSVLWSQLVRAKNCVDELRLTGKQGASLANAFERLTLRLERASRAAKSDSKDVKQLMKEKEAVVEQIRRVDGFKSFLKLTPFAELEGVASEGPVIVLNASLQGCHALVLLHGEMPTHIPLSQVMHWDVSRMARRFQELVRKSTTGEGDSKEDEAVKYLLSDLWDLVVCPIMDYLQPLVPTGSRLWWCPGGPFASIPLHAASPYRQGGPGLPQLYISSYTPTLQALIRSRAEGRSRRGSMVPRFFRSKRSRQCLTTGNQTTPATTTTATATAATTATASIVLIDSAACHGGGDDDGCRDKTVHAPDLLLRNHIPPGVPFRRLDSSEAATAESVLTALREPGAWLHIACPASLDRELPCRSGFIFARTGSEGNGNGNTTEVSLQDVCNYSTGGPHAEFAFVAGRWACGSAGPDRDGDGDDDAGAGERMNLAAMLQYSGVRSVVGTLWPVDDEAMQRVAAAFYEEIVLKAGGSMQCTDAARSLNEVLKRVWKGVPLAQQIVFVHVGV